MNYLRRPSSKRIWQKGARLAAGIVVAWQLAAISAQAQVSVTSASTLLIGKNEPVPIQKAANDLASDMTRVFGRAPRVVHQPSEAGSVTLWIAYTGALPKGVQKPSGWEILKIQALRDPWPGSPAHDAIVLTGSDMRGAIYAIYQFSQEFLGVDPLYWWTDHEPLRKTQVRLPSHFKEVQGPPTFRYRGWFINDEDLLTGWRPGTAEGTGISLKVWDRIFEAILRLKGNMIIPGTFIFPYEPQVRAAGERGLLITQHHVEPLGLNTYRWPHDHPYSFTAHPDLLVKAWTRAVEQDRNDGIVWTVGYRGEHDRPFWIDDKSAPHGEAARALVIHDAIEKEIDIVRSQRAHPQFFMNAWEEAARFVRQGLLRIPNGVTLVWPDNGHGILQDGGEIRAGQGEYYHTAMFDYLSNHFSERVPLGRIAHELGRAAKAGATSYVLINTSNIRPVVMTTRAVMELAWDAQPWTDNGPRKSSLYLEKWCREEFGPAAPVVREYYRAYFNAPAKYGEKEDDRMADNFYQTMARRLLLALVLGHKQVPVRFAGAPAFADLKKQAAFLVTICTQADRRWSEVWRIADRAKPLVPPDRQAFFQANVLTQFELQLHSNRMLMDVAKAAASRSPQQRLLDLNAAAEEEAKAREALQAADYGKWKGFYVQGDWLVDVPLTMALIKACQRKLQGKEVPEDVVVRAQDLKFAYTMIKAYQGGQQVQF